jgi:xylose isomerase
MQNTDEIKKYLTTSENRVLLIEDMTMRFAPRLNSFINQGYDLSRALGAIAAVRPDAALDLNFPEHIDALGIAGTGRELESRGLALNGMAVRYRSAFINGEFSDDANRQHAVDLGRRTVDAIRELGGTTLTLWLSYDGNDYLFQDEYERSFGKMIEGLGEIADYAAEGTPVRLSVEFKPYDPRSFSMIPGTGMSLYILKRLARANVGLTLDFCHMLMARENPSFSLALVAAEDRLFGVHLNDGHGQIDDGLMFGSVNPARAVEFVYHLKRVGYDGTVYFDTFPIREDAAEEFALNVATYERISARIDAFGIDRIGEVIRQRSGVASQQLVQEFFF